MVIVDDGVFELPNDSFMLQSKNVHAIMGFPSTSNRSSTAGVGEKFRMI